MHKYLRQVFLGKGLNLLWCTKIYLDEKITYLAGLANCKKTKKCTAKQPDHRCTRWGGGGIKWTLLPNFSQNLIIKIQYKPPKTCTLLKFSTTTIYPPPKIWQKPHGPSPWFLSHVHQWTRPTMTKTNHCNEF